ncbi:MAG: hypothetical protein B6D35_08610 [Candidatus Brocadia sp. UTAMX2]|nr:MAG: hypothetical protein B6D35_08610 [Candidatus Brocadia sp. UTAMX2]
MYYGMTTMIQDNLTENLVRFVHHLNTTNSPIIKHPEFSQYISDIKEYCKDAHAESRIALWPCLDDKTHETFFDKYYFYQDTWAARKIFEIRPKQVIDLGSTALLVGIISQFVPTISIDIRPLSVSLPGLICERAIITALPFDACTIEFLSSMSVIEHVGLGRYGDKLDAKGSIKAFMEISRIMKPGGHFLFSVPLSHTPGLSFNAHRIFSKQQIMSLLSNFRLQEELFLFPEPGTERDVTTLKGFRFCVWCAHMIKMDN